MSVCYIHDTSAPVVINHGCGHCAIAVKIGRCSDFGKVDFRVRYCSRSGTIILLIHNEYHGFCCICCSNGHLYPEYVVHIDLRIGTIC